MRNISFMLTTAQIRARSKFVTRRMGWLFAKPGEQLNAVEKSQGLGKGGKIVRLCEIELVDVRREPLDRISTDLVYGAAEVIAEGFPDMGCNEFVMFFCNSHRGCRPETVVTRLEFKYL